MAGIRKEEAKLKNAIQPVMFQFQQRGIYRTEVIRKKLNKEPQHFSLNCEFLRQLNFDTDLSYLQQEYDARLWVREIFLNAQANNAYPPFLLFALFTLILTALHVILEAVNDEQDKADYYWIYNGFAMAFELFFYFINMFFLWIGYADSARRNSAMAKLS